MNHEKIKSLVEKVAMIRAVNVIASTSRHSENGAIFQYVPSPQHDERKEVEEIIRASAVVAIEKLESWRSATLAKLESELKGEICPQPAPDPDAYLDPVREAFGAHEGLNANWSAMAWPVSGGLVDGTWLLDDEAPEETVSLVTRKDDGSGDPAIVTICQGSVEQVLPIAKAIAAQVQHG